MRLSCHRFRANEVRLQLSVLAYNLGNLWRRLVLPTRVELVAHQSPAAAGQERRASCEARPVLLAPVGRGPSDPPAVSRDARPHLGIAGADGLNACNGPMGVVKKGRRAREVSLKSPGPARVAGVWRLRRPRRGPK